MKKKKKINFKKIKKVFKKLIKAIIDEVKEFWNKFIDLPKKVRLIIYIWLGVVVVIFALILASHNNTNFLSNYYKIEGAMDVAALDYVESNNLYPTKDSKLKLDLNVLRDYNYIYDDEITDNTCKGFSMIYYDDIDEKYVVDSYVNCDKYTTKGYGDYK